MESNVNGDYDQNDGNAAEMKNDEGLNLPINENQPEADATVQQATPDADEGKPLRKIHHGYHSSGRYKMFSNHSSANDIPRTSTGL